MNPSPDQLIEMRRLIARLNGWRFTGPYWGGDLRGLSPEGNSEIVPNWPGSLDTARELPIGIEKAFEIFLYDVMTDSRYNQDFLIGVAAGFTRRSTIWYTSFQWCLAWLLYKGYRWDEKALEFVSVK